MFGSIWLSAILVVVAMFSASVAIKSYNDLKEAKEIQENYEIVSEVKTLLAKQYNKPIDEISRDEIMLHLPMNGNWEKVLLTNRRQDSTLSNSELVNSDGNFILDENERVKLLALRAKLKSYGNESSINKENNSYTFTVGEKEKNFAFKDNIITNRMIKVIEIFDIEIASSTLSQTLFNSTIQKYTPYNEIYQIVKKDNETLEQYNKRKEEFFKDKIVDELLLGKNSKDMRIYNSIKDLI